MDIFKPRRVRIVEKNMVTYSGPIGGVEFKDGVSVRSIDYPTAQRIGACIAIVDADAKDSNDLITPAAASLRDRNINVNNADVQAFDNGTIFNPERYDSIVFHTQEELEEIADKGGLPQILALAQRWGRKGRTIPACIAAILQEQDKARAAKLQRDKIAEQELQNPVEEAAEQQAGVVEEAKAEETVDAPETAAEDETKAEEHSEEVSE